MSAEAWRDVAVCPPVSRSALPATIRFRWVDGGRAWEFSASSEMEFRREALDALVVARAATGRSLRAGARIVWPPLDLHVLANEAEGHWLRCGGVHGDSLGRRPAYDYAAEVRRAAPAWWRRAEKWIAHSLNLIGMTSPGGIL